MRQWIRNAANSARAKLQRRQAFNLHLVSDSTGETLRTVGRAVTAQYGNWRANERIHPMVRDAGALAAVLDHVESEPGIVLYTLIDPDLSRMIRERCAVLGLPSADILTPITQIFDNHLGERMSGHAGAQHVLSQDYLDRLEAMKFAMAHDDGNLPDDMESADIVLVGISRTSKTPTSMILAQRGARTTNLPLVPGVELPKALVEARRPLVVALVASAERIRQVRENRLVAFDRDLVGASYVDRATIGEELAWTRRLCRLHGWPSIDVTRRSVEETAAAVAALWQDHREGFDGQSQPQSAEDTLPS